VYELADPDTIVCRCEVVRTTALATAIDATDDINVVKSYTRAGMGPCQGRICQRHIVAMIARRHGRRPADVALPTARMPLRPVPIGALADHAIPDPGLFLAEEIAP
jgi:D-hydroxyproline dehydrogenase subunit alpha